MPSIRTLSDEKEKKRYKVSIPPPEFDLEVRLIWLSNIDYTDPKLIATLPVHFHAMVSKGLDPFWIPNDAENGGRDVFIYTHYLATEKNGLGGEGYGYTVARQAVEFYVTHVHRLIDIPPRRLSMIAKVIAENPNPRDRDDRLEGMLRNTDQRPKLTLPEPWVPVLLWPRDPPKCREPIVHPDDHPTPEPDPIAATSEPDPAPFVPPTPEPEPITATPEPDPAPVVPPTPEPDPIAATREPAPAPLVPPTPQPDLNASPTPEPKPVVPPVTPTSDPLAAIMDAELPLDMDDRRGAFFGAVQQIEALGAGLIVWEAVEFLKHAEQGLAKRLFSHMTTRRIIEASRSEIEQRRGHGDGTSAVVEGDGVDKKSDLLTAKIAEIRLGDTIDETNETFGLPKLPYARQETLWTRAAVFQLLGAIEDREFADKAMLQLKHRDAKFWRSVSQEPCDDPRPIARHPG